MSKNKEDSQIREADECCEKRSNPLLTYFRGHTFFFNLEKLLNSEKAMKNLELLRQRAKQQFFCKI